MKSSELLRKLQKDGWVITKQQDGSHFIMCHPSKKAPTPTGCLTVTFHGGAEVGKGLAAKLLKQAGLR